MSITVVIKMIGGWLLIDLCFLAIFQDETNFITQEFQNTAELFIYFPQLLSNWQLAFGGSYVQKLPIGSCFILAKCGAESEVHLIPNIAPPPPFFKNALNFFTFCSLLFPLVPPAENKNGLETEAVPQIKGIRVFVVAACNFGFS